MAMSTLETPRRQALGPLANMPMLAFLALAFLLVAAPSLAQDEEPSATDDVEVEGGGSLTNDEVDFGAIDDLLAADEEVLSDPDTYSYDPGARRDPFRSLIQRQKGVEEPTKRPEGIAGLLIEELELEGIFVLDNGPVVQVKAATEETSFLLRPGDELWDGDVIRITLDEVVFKQSVDDPTALKPFREVVKTLSPAAE